MATCQVMIFLGSLSFLCRPQTQSISLYGSLNQRSRCLTGMQTRLGNEYAWMEYNQLGGGLKSTFQQDLQPVTQGMPQHSALVQQSQRPQLQPQQNPAGIPTYIGSMPQQGQGIQYAPRSAALPLQPALQLPRLGLPFPSTSIGLPQSQGGIQAAYPPPISLLGQQQQPGTSP